MKPSPFLSGRSGRGNQHQLNASMNVVPYIDVMLVLLVIFMVTTPMLTTGVDIDLPRAQADNIGSGTQMPVVVSLQSNGDLFMSYENDIDVPVSEDVLIETLQQLNTTTDGSSSPVKVMINADQNNQYGMIMQLMANLQQSGITSVGLLTGQPIPASSH